MSAIVNIGAVVDSRYHVRKLLGRGGMGAVYLVDDSESQSRLALKVMLSEISEREESLLRFRREVRSLSQLKHDNIVRVISNGRINGFPYFTMEYVEGHTLDEFHGAQRSNLAPADFQKTVISLSLQICRALAYLHSHRLIHRDLKPNNVMVTLAKKVKLMDFGLVKHLDISTTFTRSGVILGTIDYMSPEQIRGTNVDARSDLYSLGIVLYQLFTGKKPFEADTPVSIMMKHVQEIPLEPQKHVPSLPDELNRIIMKLLSKNPMERYPSAELLGEELRNAMLTDLPVSLDKSLPSVVARPIAVTEEDERMLGKRLFQPLLIGRDHELALLNVELEKLKENRSVGIFIQGSPGVGKTRLLTEFLSTISLGGYQIFEGRAHEETDFIYGPFRKILYDACKIINDRKIVLSGNLVNLVKLLTRINPQIAEFDFIATAPEPAEIQPEFEKQRLYDVFVSLLKQIAVNFRLILVFEDLQWLDEPSLELLNMLIRNLVFEDLRSLGSTETATPVMLVGLYQHDTLRDKHPLLKTVRQTKRDYPVTNILLERLDTVATQHLIQSMLGTYQLPERLTEVVFEYTDGNPLFSEELVRSMFERKILYNEKEEWFFDTSRYRELQITENIMAIVERRLEMLDEEERKLLTIASVIGKEFDFEILLEVGDYDEDDLLDLIDTLIKSKVIKEAASSKGDRFEFLQPMVKEIVYQEMVNRRRTRLHAKIGLAFEAIYNKQIAGHYQDLAYHFRHGNVPDKALVYSLEAGKQAKLSHANDNALENFDVALGVYDQFDEAPQAEYLEKYLNVLWEKGDLLFKLSRFEASFDTFSEMRKLAVEHHRHPQSEEALSQLVKVVLHLNDETKATEYTNRAMEEFSAINDIDRIASCYNYIAYMSAIRGRFKEAMENSEKAREILEGTEHRSTYAFTLHMQGCFSLPLGKHEQAASLLQQAIDLRKELGEDYKNYAGLNNLGIIAFNTGAYSEALQHYEESLELQKKIGHNHGRVLTHTNIGNVHFINGRYRLAQENYQDAIRVGRRVNNLSGTALALTNFGELAIYLGEFDMAEEALNQAMQLRQDINDKQGQAFVLRMQGMLAFFRCEYVSAIQKLTASLDEFVKLEHAPDIVKAKNSLGYVLLEIGRLESAGELLEEATTQAEKMHMPAELGFGQANLARYFYYTGDIPSSIELVKKAMEISSRSKDVRLQIICLAASAELSVRSMQIQQALESIQSGLKMAEVAEDLYYQAHFNLLMAQINNDMGNHVLAKSFCEEVAGLKERFPSPELAWQLALCDYNAQPGSREADAVEKKKRELIHLVMRLLKKFPSDADRNKYLQSEQRAGLRKIVSI